MSNTKSYTDSYAVQYEDDSWTKYNADNIMHCEDGPAVYRPGVYYQWWVNGYCHRLDGPAVLRLDEPDESVWYIWHKHIKIY
jgi:hypothetical protein